MAGGVWQTLKARGATLGTGARLGTVGMIAAATVAVYLLVCLVLGWWWDYEPDTFDVHEHARIHARNHDRPLVIGYTTTATMLRMADTLLGKRGGYLSNDLFPPGVWMDNVPNWEFGVLTQIRDAARAYRIDFSRSQSQSREDPDLSIAEGKFFFDNSSWAFPPSESEYRDGIRLFARYLNRLANANDPSAQFYARADNLQQWLQGVETRLGSLSQRLSASVGKRQLSLAVPGDPATDTPEGGPDEGFQTPWMEIDDVFFEVRGQTWALLHLLKAMEHDFGDILDNKNARVSLQQIIRELEPTQDAVWSPVILNGDGLGLLANHSLVMASYVSRANAGISDLRSLLARG